MTNVKSDDPEFRSILHAFKDAWDHGLKCARKQFEADLSKILSELPQKKKKALKKLVPAPHRPLPPSSPLHAKFNDQDAVGPAEPAPETSNAQDAVGPAEPSPENSNAQEVVSPVEPAPVKSNVQEAVSPGELSPEKAKGWRQNTACIALPFAFSTSFHQRIVHTHADTTLCAFEYGASVKSRPPAVAKSVRIVSAIDLHREDDTDDF